MPRTTLLHITTQRKEVKFLRRQVGGSSHGRVTIAYVIVPQRNNSCRMERFGLSTDLTSQFTSTSILPVSSFFLIRNLTYLIFVSTPPFNLVGPSTSSALQPRRPFNLRSFSFLFQLDGMARSKSTTLPLLRGSVLLSGTPLRTPLSNRPDIPPLLTSA